jgi:hypothetical protein
MDTPKDFYRNTSDAELWFSIYSLVVNYWREVDYNGGLEAHSFYAADGSYVVGDNHFDTREGIQTFYTWRRGREKFGSRHLVSDLVVVADGESHAKGFGVVTLYRATGRPPFRSTAPALISDATCDCVCEKGAWRFKSYIIEPVFVGDDVPLSLSVNTQHLAMLKHTKIDERNIVSVKPRRIG